MDIGEIEREQLDYIKRNGITIPSEDPFPDIGTKQIDVPIVLTAEQEEKIIQDLRAKIKEEAEIENTPVEKIKKDAQSFTFSGYIKLISRSFVGIMDDLLNFDGNIEEFSIIFTKENRLVFVATILIIISLFLLRNKSPVPVMNSQ
jgi:hypothetical protein